MMTQRASVCVCVCGGGGGEGRTRETGRQAALTSRRRRETPGAP